MFSNFDIKFRETSENISSFSLYRHCFYFDVFLWVLCLSWNFVRFHEILHHTDAKNVSFLSWQTKKFYSWKIYEQVSKSKQPALFINPIFGWNFLLKGTTKIGRFGRCILLDEDKVAWLLQLVNRHLGRNKQPGIFFKFRKSFVSGSFLLIWP